MACTDGAEGLDFFERDIERRRTLRRQLEPAIAGGAACQLRNPAAAAARSPFDGDRHRHGVALPRSLPHLAKAA
jgi:hypothetical protein